VRRVAAKATVGSDVEEPSRSCPASARGGGRNAAPRVRLSMTIMGEPQCRQMNAGRVSMTVSG